MADKTAEQLSALVDCECEAWELEFALHRLAKDLDLKARWQCYHLIGDTLKNNLPERVDTHFAERVRATLAQDASPPADPKRAMWYRLATGGALAASLALVVAAVTLKTYGPDKVPPVAMVTQLPAPMKSPLIAFPPDNKALDVRLSSYIVNHNEYASMNSVHGMLSYVRMVDYEPGR